MASTYQMRPMTKADWLKYGGERFPESVRGIVTEKDGEILALAGVIQSPTLQAFSFLEDGLRKSPKAIVKMAKAFRELLNLYDQDVYAIACPKEKTSGNFLVFIGFEFDEVTDQGRLYRWRTR